MTGERSPGRVLVVDDEAAARLGMRRALEADAHQVDEAPDGEAALAALDVAPADLVFLDINMPGQDGLEVLSRIRERPLAPPVVMVTAHGSERVAVEAMKRGAYDYLAKPYDVEELRLVARRALDHDALARENRALRESLAEGRSFGPLVGDSAPMRRLYQALAQVAATDATVLIQGESGTGKELVARELHRRGGRAAGPFVAVNCAALPEGLMESEILGHEKGAFTGASERRAGRFEQADRGTLFLDEIGDMPLALQAKLLRVLEDRVVERLGGGRPVQVDVRLVAATNQDLAAAVEEGRFREDLYYRLKVVDLCLPPLRARREDIPLLVARFLSRYAAEHARPVRGLSPGALGRLVAHDWPGNVRQLANLVERCVVLAGGETIREEDLPAEVLAPPPGAPRPPGEGNGLAAGAPWGTETLALPLAEAKAHLLRRFETAYIEARLEEHRGNISAAARSMGVHRQSLQQKLRELGVHPNRYKD